MAQTRLLSKRMPQPSDTSIGLGDIRAVYGTYAPIYDLTFGLLTAHLQRRLIRRCEFFPGARVLEMGAGTGLSLPLYPADVAVTAVDASPDMLSRAHERVRQHALDNVELRQADAEATGLAGGSFDYVMLMFVLSVTPHPERLVKEALRLVRPGGSVLILNHFQGGLGMEWLEARLAGMARRIGFRSDFPLAAITDIARPQSVEDFSALGFFKLVRLQADR